MTEYFLFEISQKPRPFSQTQILRSQNDFSMLWSTFFLRNTIAFKCTIYLRLCLNSLESKVRSINLRMRRITLRVGQWTMRRLSADTRQQLAQ